VAPVADETHRWVRRVEAGIACGVSAGIVTLCEAYVGLSDLL
jgi:hypothetical protein